MSVIVFYCNVEKSLLNTVEFYKQDILALKELGHKVIICNKYREIPFRFDMMFIWWWTYAAWPVIFAKILKKPSVVTGTFNFKFPKNFTGMDYFHRPLHEKLLIQMALKYATKNVFVSKKEYRLCTDYFSLTNSTFCHHTIDSKYMKGPSLNRELSLLNISWSGKHNIIRKGIPQILSAVSQLKKDGHPNLKLLMAGHEGDGIRDIVKMITDLDLSDNVTYLGEISLEKKIELLRKCEIYIQPSQYEGFGLAIAEAMGCGACVITSKVGAVEEVVGSAGIYVDPSSIEDIVYAIKSVLIDGGKRRHYQEWADKRAKKLFSQSKKVSTMKKMLKELFVQ